MEDNQCEPCQSRGIHEISVTKCVDCDEALCAACTDTHRSMKALRNHQLVDIKALPPQLDLGLQTCSSHNLAFEYFCIDNDVLCCKECLAETHRKCTKVMSIDVACKGCKQSQPFVDSSELLGGVLGTLRALQKEKMENKSAIERDTENIAIEISKAKARILHRIDEIEKQLLRELDEKKQKSFDGINTQLSLIKEIEGNSFEKMEKFEFVEKYGNDRQAFILSHSATKELHEIESNLEDIVQNCNTYKLGWKEHFLKDELFFGSVELKTTRGSAVKCLFEKKTQSQVPVNFDKRTISFSFDSKLDLRSVGGAMVDGMTFTNDNSSLLLCDSSQGTKARILVYDRSNKYQFSIGLKHEPWDLVEIPGTKRVVITPVKGSNLQIASVSADKSQDVESVALKDIEMAGISINNQNIFVGGNRTLFILDHHCNLQRTIPKIHKGLLWSICLCDSTSDVFWFSDSVDVICSSTDGKIIAKYNSPKLQQPRKIAKDKNGCLYVAGRKSDNIHRFKPDGTFVDIVLDASKNIDKPVALCFDRCCTQMYVSHKNGIEVIIFNVS